MSKDEEISVIKIHKLLMSQNDMFIKHISITNEQFTKSLEWRTKIENKFNDLSGARDILNHDALEELVAVKNSLKSINDTQTDHEAVIIEYKKLKTEAEGAIKAAKSLSFFSLAATVISGILMWMYHKIINL